ncbi:hypothetical protein GWC95_07130 [Sediminibacterium roseum]|uniref:Uncharacterized protein n=1 Tax=Sediminibacterium roseum TaxID=1978412 RepID=A0ABW9ZWV4_9BACT|nr:hypothetical protein [Sediminibacterium roseum]NCI49688.1 hypothetical protein [Sediminibacterium roseum]
MKKYVTGLAAVILAISASAFTKATEKKEGEFYRDGDVILPITTNGQCLEGTSNYCTYHLKEGKELPTTNPDDFEGEGPVGFYWQP